ncbi:MAG: hypothetical protein P8Y09_09400 [Deltaproteobacteria bacterium]|jgi:ribosomal protein L37E
MNASNKETAYGKQDTDKYLTCPRCGERVSYHQRLRHSCYRSYMVEMQREMARMDWSLRMW